MTTTSALVVWTVLMCGAKRGSLAHLQAIELDDTLALPHIAACTSMGRLALLSDNKTKVRLAHDAREEAVTALALEPSNDLAHHLMGRWHYEMANLNVVVRTLVRVMYGTALAPGECLSCQSLLCCCCCNRLAPRQDFVL